MTVDVCSLKGFKVNLGYDPFMNIICQGNPFSGSDGSLGYKEMMKGLLMSTEEETETCYFEKGLTSVVRLLGYNTSLTLPTP